MQYNPRRFSAAIFRQRQSSSRQHIASSETSSSPLPSIISTASTTILLFKSGKFVCTGAKSTVEANVASRRFARSIQKILCRKNDDDETMKVTTKRRELHFSGFTVQNVVGSFSAEFRVDLTALYAGRRNNAFGNKSYFPQAFDIDLVVVVVEKRIIPAHLYFTRDDV